MLGIAGTGAVSWPNGDSRLRGAIKWLITFSYFFTGSFSKHITDLSLRLTAFISMATTERETVEVSEELTHVRQFLQIEEARFPDSLKVEFDIEESMERELMPPMLLQPIVENALRHGRDRAGNLNISISARRWDDEVLFRISDTGETHDTADFFNGRGIGLKNVNNRLQTLHGNTVQLERNTPAGVVATIRIPAGRHGD